MTPEERAANAWANILPIFASRRRQQRVWEAWAGLTGDMKHAIDTEAEHHIALAIRQALADRK